MQLFHMSFVLSLKIKTWILLKTVDVLAHVYVVLKWKIIWKYLLYFFWVTVYYQWIKSMFVSELNDVISLSMMLQNCLKFWYFSGH